MLWKKGVKVVRFLVLVWLIINLSLLPFAAAYTDDNGIFIIKKTFNPYTNGSFGKVTPILGNSLTSANLKREKLAIRKPNLFILITWSLFITLLTSFIYFKQNKKSQLTIFFLLGIVMISLFLFIYYLKHSVTETRLKKEVKKISTEVLETPAIKNYVQICLDDSVKEALVLVGLQGGNIYKSNNTFGLEIDSGPGFDAGDYGLLGIQVNLSEYNISEGSSDLIYAITKPQIDGYHPDVPLYPYEGNLKSRLVIGNNTIRNPLGSNPHSDFHKILSLRALCSRQGSNYINASIKESCEEDLYEVGGSNTVQVYLEEYIKKKVKQCLNFSSFIPETGFEIEEGNITIEVLFGENNVYVTMEYPLKITIEGEAPVTKFLLYSSDIDVRFKKIYELAYHMIKEDVSNIFFDMSDISQVASLNDCPTFDPNYTIRDIYNRQCWEEGMNVTKEENVCPNYICSGIGNYSDVYIITDNQSLIDGKPFVFLFTAENRRPALDYMDDSIDSSSYYYGYLAGNTYYERTPLEIYRKSNQNYTAYYDEEYNIIVDVYQSIEILPFGIDPDNERILSYSYSGWLTPIEINDTSGAYLDGNSSLWSTNHWERNYSYYYGFYGAYPPNIAPGLYKDANLDTSPNDVGVHWVRVNVSDEQGLLDYQDIKIQVRCINSLDHDPSDCCDDYYEYSPGSGCGAHCMVCDGQGGCVLDMGRGADCGPCRDCSGDSAGGCIDLDSPEDPRGECAALHGGGNAVCCAGSCNDRTAVDEPWVIDPAKDPDCYEHDVGCDGADLIYRPLPLPCSTCGAVDVGDCICDDGVCIDSTA